MDQLSALFSAMGPRGFQGDGMSATWDTKLNGDLDDIDAIFAGNGTGATKIVDNNV